MQVKIRSAPCNDSSPITDNEQELNRQFPSAVDLEQDKIRDASVFSKSKEPCFSNVFRGPMIKTFLSLDPQNRYSLMLYTLFLIRNSLLRNLY